MFGIFKMTRSAASLDAQAVSKVESSQDIEYVDIWLRHRANHPASTDELLRARLAETVTWCDSLRSPSEFRSASLRPRLFHDGPDDLVCDLGRNRQHQLRHKKLKVSSQAPVVATGRFMLYFPDENLADGYAEEVSGGFFDVDNLPAFDTWVSLISDDGYPRESARRQLLCYVPVPLIEVANAGIDGNPEECIVWLDQSNFSIRRRVESMTSAAPLR